MSHVSERLRGLCASVVAVARFGSKTSRRAEPHGTGRRKEPRTIYKARGEQG